MNNRVQRRCDDPSCNEPDETISERLWGLTEMLPDSVRNVCGQIASASRKGLKSIYNFTCTASWIFFTTSIVLFVPVIFESERAQIYEMQKAEEQTILLGPNAAVANKRR